MKTKDYISRFPSMKRIIWFIKFIVTYIAILGGVWTFLDPLDPLGLDVLNRFGIFGYIGLLLTSMLLTVIYFYFVFYIEKPQRELIDIETELEKNNKNIKPERLRKGAKGPYWIDFKKDYICERPEVDEIIRKLESDHIQVVEGDPASGKSVLLKHIGFKLATQEKYMVYYIGCKVKSEEDIKTYFKEACEIDDPKTLIIIDDYHLQKQQCEKFLEQYQKNKKNTKVLIGTRLIDERRNMRIANLSKTEIEPQNISKDIITTYLKEQYGWSDEELEEVSWQFSAYEDNLLAFSWALDAFKPDKGEITLNDIYKDVKKWIEEIDERNKRQAAEDIFLPLSILNRDEVPVEKHFLTDTENGLGIEKQRINVLLDQHEILLVPDIKGTISMDGVTLPHSKLAELIFETYWETSLGEDIIRDIIKISGNGDKDKFEKGFLFYYLCHSDLLYYIDTNSLFFQDFVVSLIEQNRSNDELKNKIREAIQHNINSDKDLEELELYSYGYLHSGLPTEFVTELVQELDFTILAGRLNETDDIGRVSSFFGSTQGLFLKKLMGQIDLENLKSKVINDIWALSGILGALANTDKAITRCILDMVGIPHIKEMFSKSKIFSAEEMGRCYGTVAAADDKLAHELSLIIKARLKEMHKSSEEDIPDDSPLEEVMPLIQGAADAQSLYGSHYAVLDTLLSALEELLKEKIQQQTWYYVDMSGEDYTEQEAREAVLEDIKRGLWEWFGYWVDAETFERTYSHICIT